MMLGENIAIAVVAMFALSVFLNSNNYYYCLNENYTMKIDVEVVVGVQGDI